ncbi:MAG: SurA N-terminal domain-containing protein [Desulfomonile tiedjei]|uniref:Periplasmic chaperone PpiD n=1 Tax=Desulfomonile tiedjei TaxID=2358 RepID=A0A9D6V1I1_9BACT|nr:SurA N-terminal domain-containing protein [Desulfomonile tiedjei]
MLDLMRKHASSWLIKVALGGIILVFIFFFGWSGPGDRSGNYAAKVNDTVVSYDHFYNVYESELEKMRLRFKGAIPQELFEKLNLKRNVVQALVNRVLLLEEAKRLGLFVNDGDLVQDIRTNPMFQRDGVFDESMYRGYLSTIKLTPTAYEETRKQELLEQQVIRLITDGVKTDPQEVKQLWHFQNDKLVLSLLLIKAEESAEQPDQKALETFFKENQASYEIPPSLDLQYVFFSWRDIQKKLSVSEDEVRSYYQNHPKEFTEPERIHARHILFKIEPDATPELIEQVRKRAEFTKQMIEGGNDFKTVAQSESQDETTRDRGGDLGFFSRGTMNRELEKTAFGLEMGKVSDPFRTQLGYHVLVVEEQKPETVLDFELAKDKIEHKLLEEKARKRIGPEADTFYEQVYRSEDLESPAKQFDLQVRSANFVTRAGGIPDVTSDAKIMDEAFALKIGEISRLDRLGDNFLVMKLTTKHKERIPDLQEVRSAVEKDYVKQQAFASARKKADEIIDTLKQQPAEADQIAKKFGLEWEKLEPISRTAGFVPKLGGGQEISEMLTSLSKANSLYSTPISTSAGVAVVRLTDVVDATDEQFAKDAPAFEKWILEVRRTDFLKGWLKLLEGRAKITLNEKVL